MDGRGLAPKGNEGSTLNRGERRKKKGGRRVSDSGLLIIFLSKEEGWGNLILHYREKKDFGGRGLLLEPKREGGKRRGESCHPSRGKTIFDLFKGNWGDTEKKSPDDFGGKARVPSPGDASVAGKTTR